jgi:hypothetical protein
MAIVLGQGEKGNKVEEETILQTQDSLKTPFTFRRALLVTREAAVDDLEIGLADLSKYKNQVEEFVCGTKKPDATKFIVELSDLSLKLQKELSTFPEADQKYILLQAVTRLFENIYFLRYYNPRYNYTKNGFSWSSFLMYGCCIPEVEALQQ